MYICIVKEGFYIDFSIYIMYNVSVSGIKDGECVKKYIALIITVLLIMFCMPFGVSAQNGVLVTADNNFLKAGDTVTFTVTFTAPAEMTAFSYTVCYDSAYLSFVSTSASDYNSSIDGKIYYIAEAGGITKVTETFTFTCISVGESGIDIKDICCADSNEYTYSDVSFSFSVERCTAGDVNNDGFVSAGDLATLKLYLAGQNVEINYEYSDLNGDGEVMASDLAELKLLLAGAM